MHKLTTDINLVVIVWGNSQWHRPHKSVLEIGRGRSIYLVWPHLDISGLTVAQIVTFDNSANTSRTGGTRPDDIGINRIGSGPTAFSAGDCMPGASRNLTCKATASGAA